MPEATVYKYDNSSPFEYQIRPDTLYPDIQPKSKPRMP